MMEIGVQVRKSFIFQNVKNINKKDEKG